MGIIKNGVVSRVQVSLGYVKVGPADVAHLGANVDKTGRVSERKKISVIRFLSI